MKVLAGKVDLSQLDDGDPDSLSYTIILGRTEFRQARKRGYFTATVDNFYIHIDFDSTAQPPDTLPDESYFLAITHQPLPTLSQGTMIGYKACNGTWLTLFVVSDRELANPDLTIFQNRILKAGDPANN